MAILASHHDAAWCAMQAGWKYAKSTVAVIRWKRLLRSDLRLNGKASKIVSPKYAIPLAGGAYVVWVQYYARDGLTWRGYEHVTRPLKDRICDPSSQSGSAALQCGHLEERREVRKHALQERGAALIVYGQRESGKSWTVANVLMGSDDLSVSSHGAQQYSTGRPFKPSTKQPTPIVAYVKLKNVTTVSQLAEAIERAFQYRGLNDLVNLVQDCMHVSSARQRQDRKKPAERLARALRFAELVSEEVYRKHGQPLVIVLDDIDAIRAPWSHARGEMEVVEPLSAGGAVGMQPDDDVQLLQTELVNLVTRLAGWARDSHISPIVICSDQRKAHVLFGQKNSNFDLLEWGGLADEDIGEAVHLHLQALLPERSICKDEAVTRKIGKELQADVAAKFGRRPGPLRKLFLQLQDDFTDSLMTIQEREEQEQASKAFTKKQIQDIVAKQLRESLRSKIDECHQAATNSYRPNVHACIRRTSAQMRTINPNITPIAVVKEIHGALGHLVRDLGNQAATTTDLNNQALLSVGGSSSTNNSSQTLIELRPTSANIILRHALLDACVLEGVDPSHVSVPSPACLDVLRECRATLGKQLESLENCKEANTPPPPRVANPETEARILAEQKWRTLDRLSREKIAALDREERAAARAEDREERAADREERAAERILKYSALFCGVVAALVYNFTNR